MTDRNANRPGYKKTKVGWIPEDWEVRRLDSISKITMGQSPSSKYYNSDGKGLPLIQGNSDIFNRKTKPRFWTSELTKQCKPGDLILSVRAPVGSVAKSNHLGCIGRGVCAISCSNSSDYLYQLLVYMEPKWTRFAQGSTFEAVVSNDVRGFRIPYPPHEEWEKIAEILSTWDRAIEQTRDLIDAKRKLKHGLMQQLLTGRMRFPGFGPPVKKRDELPEGWERKRLKKIAEIIVSNVDKKTKHSEETVLLCNYMDVYENYYLSSLISYMNATATEREIEKFQLLENDIVITKDSETREDIAKPSIVLEYVDRLLCGYHLAVLRAKEISVDPLFLTYMLDFGSVHDYFVSHANGVTRFGLTISVLGNAKIRLPNADEQYKISNLLFVIDKEVEYLLYLIEYYKDQKKGLMQKLLTGEVRV